MRWSVFCRVIDNFGDIGFAWRLAADLAARGERVSLAADDASALAWLAPGGAPGVEVVKWHQDDAGEADVIVETFGAGVPAAVVDAQARRRDLAVHVNVEHLTAEAYAMRSHGLASPRALADGRNWPRWFFFPGFVAGSGGLLREPWAVAPAPGGLGEPGVEAGIGVQRRAGERCVFVFSYAQPALAALIDALASKPTLLLLAPGAATGQATASLGATLARGQLRAMPMPLRPQRAFDRLLAACDLAFVRGEDSPVRAIWAGVPFCWQLYPQQDRAHDCKREAFLDVYLQGAPAALAADLGRWFRAWNGGDAGGLAGIGDSIVPWQRHARATRDALAGQSDLTSRLIGFVDARRSGAPD